MLSLFELRQSTAELLAYAVSDLFPGALLVEGHATEFGFYYDFIAQQPIDDQALPWLEEKIRAVVKSDVDIRSLDMMRENAIAFFLHKEQPLIARRVEEAQENIVSVLQMGDFYDYCPFNHISEKQDIAAFKLLKVEKTTHYIEEEGEVDVTRIHGTVFTNKERLKKYLKTIESGKKRDHRQIGKDLDLFDLNEEAGHFGWFWHSKGERLREILIDWWKKELRLEGFEVIKTPAMLKKSLLKKLRIDAGLIDRFDLPYCEIHGIEYVMTPSLSIAHALFFRSKFHSYRKLPVRYAECSPVTLAGKRGKLWGLLNAETVWSDRAHIFCHSENMKGELISSLQFIEKFTNICGFECHWSLKGRSQKYAGTLRLWEKAQECVVAAFEELKLSYEVDQHEGRFDGPAAEGMLVDALGREWKGPSVAIDFNTPERFGLSYHGVDDEKHVPLMISRTLFGSLERFIAILLEHHSGQLPLWLAPEQVRVIAVNEGNRSYAEGVYRRIEQSGYRVGIDSGHEQLGTKVHRAEGEKVPYMIIVGDKEEKQHLITVRSGRQEIGRQGINLDVFLKQMQEELSSPVKAEVSK